MKLVNILNDRAILSNNGIYEALFLYDGSPAIYEYALDFRDDKGKTEFAQSNCKLLYERLYELMGLINFSIAKDSNGETDNNGVTQQ